MSDDNNQANIMRAAAWDMYMSAVLGMSYHPGTTRDAAVRRSPEELASIVDDIIKQRDKRFGRV